MGKPYPFVVAIVQARLGAKRFPNKMLADLNGKPVLEHVIDRLLLADNINQICVASPDEELVNIAARRQVWGFLAKDEPDNVLARYMKCSNWCGADIVVRITGDCPLLDPKLVDICVKGYVENRVDISTNVLRRSYPRGMDVEVLHSNVIKRLFHLSDRSDYREHVTLMAYDNPALFRFHSVINSEDFSAYNCSIDYPEDLDICRQFLLSLKSEEYSFKEVADWLRNHIGYKVPSPIPGDSTKV